MSRVSTLIFFYLFVNIITIQSFSIFLALSKPTLILSASIFFYIYIFVDIILRKYFFQPIPHLSTFIFCYLVIKILLLYIASLLSLSCTIFRISKSNSEALSEGRGRFVSSAVFAERNRKRVLQTARNKKCLHPEVHIIFSSTHVQKPCVFKYLKQTGRPNF